MPSINEKPIVATKMSSGAVVNILKDEKPEAEFWGEVRSQINAYRIRTASWKKGGWKIYTYRNHWLIAVVENGKLIEIFDLEHLTSFPVRAPARGFFLLEFKKPMASLSIKFENPEKLKELYKILSDRNRKKSLVRSVEVNKPQFVSNEGVENNPVTSTPKNQVTPSSSNSHNQRSTNTNIGPIDPNPHIEQFSPSSSPVYPTQLTEYDKENQGERPRKIQTSTSRTPLSTKRHCGEASTSSGLAADSFYGPANQRQPQFNSSVNVRPTARRNTKLLLQDETKRRDNIIVDKRRKLESNDLCWKNGFSDTPLKSSHGSELKGFSNLGNTCYMNAILQALLGIDSFSKELLKTYEDLGGIVDHQNLFHSLVTLLKLQHTCSNDEKRVALQKVKFAISNSARIFCDNDQQDAHEFLSQVLDQLNGEIEDLLKRNDQKCVNPVMNNFGFTVSHTIICQTCSNVVTNDDHLFDLALHLPVTRENDVDSASLQFMLETLFKDELVQYKCEKCSAENSLFKQVFTKVPRVLILMLKRYSFNALLERGTKVADQVIIPRYITLDAHCTNDTNMYNPVTESTKKINIHPVDLMEKSPVIIRNDNLDETKSPLTGVKRKLFDDRKTNDEETADCKIVEPMDIELDTENDDLQKAIELSKNHFEKEKFKEDRELQEAIDRSMQESYHAGEDQYLDEDYKLAVKMSLQHSSVDNDDDIVDCVPDSQPMETDHFDDKRNKSSSQDSVVSSVSSVLSCDDASHCEKVISFYFNPVDLSWQQTRATFLGINVSAESMRSHLTTSRQIHINSPPIDRQVIGADGNCLFRALSFIIVGNENFHEEIRKQVVSFMKKNSKFFSQMEGWDNSQFDRENFKMSENSTWGTWLELLALATLLQTQIYTYIRAEGGKFAWTKYGPCFPLDDLEPSDRIIMLANESCHYEPVFDVEDKLLQSSLDEKLEQKINKNCEDGSMPHSFHLASVVSHIGRRANFGHYVCDVWNQKDDSWRSCDDSRVTTTSETNVRQERRNDSYIFFFLAKDSYGD